MNNGKLFDLPPKCPGMLSTKLTGLFGWRHTYRVHHRQKGISHYNQQNLQKTYSLNLQPKKLIETSASNPSLPEASSTNPESWVVVHHLQSQSGILDPDDHVHDVADDREQILASYDDHPGPDPSVPQGGGDGASGSSVGTGSPDIFRVQDGKYTNHNENVETHIDVGESDQPPNGLTLQVRRGSEPSLLTLDQNAQLYPSQNSQEPSKRWSAAPVCREDPPERLLTGATTNGTYLSPKWAVPEEESHNESLPSFSRSGRLSMQFLGDGANYRWIEAAEKAAINHNPNSNNSSYSSKSLPRDAKRKEPLGQANASTYESIRQKNGEMLLVTNETGGPLGLSAIPDQENGGLLVQSVEHDSRAEKGRLRRGDRILEINGINLMELPETSVQEQLRKCIASSELRLRVIRARSESQRDRNRTEMFEAEEKSIANSKVAHVSPTRKVPGTMTTSSLQAANTRKLGKRIEISLKKGSHGLGFSVTTRDNPAGGHCPIYIKNILPKGAAVEDGRLKPGDRLLEVDNVTMTGKSQSEVVNILRSTTTGATVKIVVSRQQEISESDEREIGADTQPKQPPPPVLPKNVLKSPSAPNILDVIKKGTNKEQEFQDSVKMRIKKLNTSSPDQNGNIFPWRNREILTLYIPVHDTEKAGLGVSVKGKTGQMTPNSSLNGTLNTTNAKHDGDLGIFIKSVLHGGAASRDGRLKMNDQLLSVNGISLLGQSNADAMDTLRRAMLQTGGNNPGVIVLKIARRASSRPGSTIIENGEQNVIDSSGTNSSEQSGSTVIYLSPTPSNDKNSNVVQKSHSPTTPQENGKRWSNPVIDRLTGGNGMGTRPSTLMQPIPGGLRNDSYYMATNDTWSPMANLNGSNAVLIEEDPEPTSPTSIMSLRPDMQHQMSTSTPTSGDITYASQLSLENPAGDAFSRDAIGRRSMSEKHHAAMDARETGTYQRNKKMREEREKSQIHSSVESLTNVNTNRIGSMKTSRQRSDLRSEAMDRVGELGPSLGMKKSSSLESLQTMVQEIQMSDEPRGPNALRAPRGRGREEVLRAAVERPEPRKHWLLEDGGDNDGGFSNRGALQSSSNGGSKNKDRNQKKPGLLKGIGSMFRFGKHRKDVFPAPQTEVITDYSSWSNETVKSATLGPMTSPVTLSSQSKTSQQREQREQRETSHERQLSGSSGPPLYHPPPQTTTALQNGSKITQNDAFNHRYSHYVNYDELQMQIRNKLIVTKHQSQPNHPRQHQTNNPALLNAASDDMEAILYGQVQPKHHQSGDGSENDCLSDSTIEKMRLQVRMQREKVEDESRRNHHYHSQRSARSNIDMGHYHQYSGVSPIVVNGHKYNQQAQLHAQHSLQQHPMRPISSFYEYETINPNGNYRKIGDHFNPLQNSNSSSKIVNGSSSVRITGNVARGQIPDMKPQQHHRGPFITQVHIRDQNGKHPSASKV